MILQTTAQMNDKQNIYEFLFSLDIDYINCPVNVLLKGIEAYHQIINDQSFFSAQMLLLSQSVEENRTGTDAIRVSIKSLELVSPKLTT